jgi:hypothetical protein
VNRKLSPHPASDPLSGLAFIAVLLGVATPKEAIALLVVVLLVQGGVRFGGPTKTA